MCEKVSRFHKASEGVAKQKKKAESFTKEMIRLMFTQICLKAFFQQRFMPYLLASMPLLSFPFFFSVIQFVPKKKSLQGSCSAHILLTTFAFYMHVVGHLRIIASRDCSTDLFGARQRTLISFINNSLSCHQLSWWENHALVSWEEMWNILNANINWWCRWIEMIRKQKQNFSLQYDTQNLSTSMMKSFWSF